MAETWLVLIVPATVLIGWQFNLELLKRIDPNFVAMNPITAVCFIACGTALLMLRATIPGRYRRLLAAVLMLAVAIIALLVLGHYYVWHSLVEPDRWLYTSKLDVPGQQPNVMAPNTAFAFFLSSISLLIVNVRIKQPNRFLSAQLLAVVVVFIAIFALLGYLYGTHILIAFRSYIPMAVHTAFCFMALGSAILLSWPKYGIMFLFGSDQGAGYLLRRLVIATILLPTFLGWLRIEGVNANLFDVKTGVTFLTLFTILVGLILAWVASLALYKKEREIDRTKDEFLSLATHQLQTPASGVMATLTTLRAGVAGKLKPEQAEMINDAIDANEREIRIVSDLLNVARADAGRMILKKVPTDLGELVKAIVSEQQSTIDSRQQKIDVIAPAVTAMVDADRLRMAIENLISNASKYTSEGGKLSVTVKAMDAAVAITVTDSGVGIAKADIPKLFAKFTRLPNALSEKRGGTGLGLYLVKQIVELHGGEIKVSSHEGKGSQFTIELPKN